MNEYNFKQFVLAIKDAGFISKKLNTSDITLDFAYTLYLRLLKDSSIDKTKVKNYVQHWYVMSTLTGRYTSSPESAMDLDLRRIKEKGFLPWLEEVEKTLSDTFWNVELVQNLETITAKLRLFHYNNGIWRPYENRSNLRKRNRKRIPAFWKNSVF